MDHHCPWVGNCVGHSNHKLFWNFLFNALCGCIIVSANMLYEAFMVSFRKFEQNSHFTMTMLFSTALIMSLGGLLSMHTFILVSNNSTLEMSQLWDGNPFAHKRRKILTASERNKKVPLQMKLFGRNPVVRAPNSNRVKIVDDKMTNWTDYMGTSAWFWPVRPFKPTCDGYNWMIYPEDRQA